MVGFQKQNLEVQKNVNSESWSWNAFIGWNLQKKLFAKFEFELHRGLNQTNNKFANKSKISQKSRKPAFVSGRFKIPSKPNVFQKSGLNKYTFREKNATESGIGSKEYTLNDW